MTSKIDVVQVMNAFALIIFGVIIYVVFGAWNSQNWPITSGEILSSTVTTGGDSRAQTSLPDIQYHYTVDGISYEGSAVTLIDLASGIRWNVQDVVARYPAGLKVSVSYDPTNPSRSVLEPGFHWHMLIPVAVASAFLLFIVARINKKNANNAIHRMATRVMPPAWVRSSPGRSHATGSHR